MMRDSVVNINIVCIVVVLFFFKQKTAYEMRISDWSSDWCSSDLWPDSVVVLDINRENYEITAGFRRKGGQKVVLFNPTHREGRTARYNPLSYIHRADPIEVLVELQKIATMLFVPPEKGEAFWTESARTAFVGKIGRAHV